jgi:hypothetical protein
VAAALVLPAARADEPDPGILELRVVGDRVWIHTQDASLNKLLQALDDMTPASLAFRNIEDVPVTVHFEDIPIDKLLAKLGVNSVLVYTVDKSRKTVSLDGGWGQSVPEGPVFQNELQFPEQVDGAVKKAFERYLNRKPYEIGYTYPCIYPASVKVDGNLDDWPSNVPWHVVSSDLGSFNATNGIPDPADYPAVPPDSNEDAAFTFASIADDDYLYVAMYVWDDRKVVDETDDDQMLWADDSIEFYIDGGFERSLKYDENDSQITIARGSGPEATDNPRMSPWAGYGSGIPGADTGTKTYVADTPNGWTVEAAIPLSTFGVVPQNGTVIGFDMHVNDDDDGEMRDHKLMWSIYEQVGGEAAWHDPSSFGQLEIFDINADPGVYGTTTSP